MRPLIEKQDTNLSQNNHAQEQNDPNLHKDNTEASIESYNYDLDSESMNPDTSVTEYENLCADLRIVPCSIILKSLPTSAVILSNYGLNSTGTLALTYALRVCSNIFIFDFYKSIYFRIFS